MIYFISINLFSFLLCGLDKWKSIHHRWRISENFLLLWSFLGGCFGFLSGMYLFHHKTKKVKFRLVFVACILWGLFLYGFFM